MMYKIMQRHRITRDKNTDAKIMTTYLSSCGGVGIIIRGDGVSERYESYAGIETTTLKSAIRIVFMEVHNI